MCLDDVALGRMEGQTQLQSELLDACNLSPRFCIEQGSKADGTPKLRAIDDLSFSNVNASTGGTEKLRCDTLDLLFEVLKGQSTSVEAK